MVEVVVAPPAAVMALFPSDPLPSHNTSHMFSPGVGRMRDNLYLHFQHINKMNSIGLLASPPYSSCIHIPHVNSNILEKCGIMVHCHKLKGSIPLTTNSLGNLGKYPWYVHPHDIECTKDPHVVTFLS